MFDFNNEAVKVFSIWPASVFPVEISSYGYCSNSCFYCFANLGRKAKDRIHEDHMKNNIEKTIRTLESKINDSKSAVGFFLRKKLPVVLSNTTDPFQNEEKIYRNTETLLKWFFHRSIPAFIQTKGNVLYEEFDRYIQYIKPGKDVVYITITTLDDEIGKFIEPGALLPSKRLELVKMLANEGIPVIVAANPYTKEWIPDTEKYVKTIAKQGAKAVAFDNLHFSAKQMRFVPEAYKKYLLSANMSEMAYAAQLEKFYIYAEKYKLDAYPTASWDAFFNYRAKEAECVKPEWIGNRITCDIARDMFIDIHNEIKENNAERGIIFWSYIKEYLDNRISNVVLKTDEFWTAFNSSVSADRTEWNNTLGKEAPLHEILRYFYNHPQVNASYLWFNSKLKFITRNKEYLVDDNRNIISVYEINNTSYSQIEEKRLEKFMIFGGD